MSEYAPELEGRIVAHLEEIAEQSESFDRVTTRLGEEGFVAAWGRSGTAGQIDLKGSVERAYEQIVNDLQGLVDLLETDAYRRRVLPDPQLLRGGSSDGRRHWWEAARELGIDISHSDTSQSPGRWRRLALYGRIDHEFAQQLIGWTESRDFLQHAYAQRTEETARRVWSVMVSLRSCVQQVVEAILGIQSD
jgi:hypothetical protein